MLYETGIEVKANQAPRSCLERDTNLKASLTSLVYTQLIPLIRADVRRNDY